MTDDLAEEKERREGEKPTPGTKDAVESLRVAIATTRSLREGRPIEISEVGT
jgi:predicted dehydrogenase